VKNVELIEVTLEEVGGAEPVTGSEVIYRNVRYCIIEVRPPKEGSRKWRPRHRHENSKWTLLVRKVDDSTPGQI
jgi:hypothetical protein